MSDDYCPIRALQQEVDRFCSTNTFTPLEVTNFYVQARVVLSLLDKDVTEAYAAGRRAGTEEMREAAARECDPDRVIHPNEAPTEELRRRCAALRGQCTALGKRIRDLPLPGDDTQAG